jgi:Caspase domain
MTRFISSVLVAIAFLLSAEIAKTSAQSQTLVQSAQSPQNRPPEEKSQSDRGIGAKRGKRFALVIGNGAYAGANPLQNPPNDARAMSAALREIGFDVAERIDLNSRDMKRAVIDFGNKLQNYEVGLFYYAGHGIQSNGKNYLIPVDAEIQKEVDISVDGVDLDTVLAQIESAKNRLNIVILDACRNTFSTRSWRSQGRGLLQISNAPSGIFIAYATAPGSVAIDNTSGQNGLYTQELLKAVRQPGLRIEEVFKQVRLRVKELSNGQQIPWESSSLEGEFYFIPTGSTVASLNTSNSSGGRIDNTPATPATGADTLKNKPNNAVNTDSNSTPPPINPDRNRDSIQRKIDVGLYDDALREGLDYLESQPNDPQLNQSLGFIYIQKGLFPAAFRHISKAIEGGMSMTFKIQQRRVTSANLWNFAPDKHGTLKVQKDGLEIQFGETIDQVPYNLVRKISIAADINNPIRLKVGINKDNKIREKDFKFNFYSWDGADVGNSIVTGEQTPLKKHWDSNIVSFINELKAKTQ